MRECVEQHLNTQGFLINLCGLKLQIIISESTLGPKQN